MIEDRVWDLRFPARAGRRGRRSESWSFGDSNTWGWIPVERGYPTTRYPAGERWPGIAQAALGGGYEIDRGSPERTDDGPCGPGRAGVARCRPRRQRVSSCCRRLTPAARPRRHHARQQRPEDGIRPLARSRSPRGFASSSTSSRRRIERRGPNIRRRESSSSRRRRCARPSGFRRRFSRTASRSRGSLAGQYEAVALAAGAEFLDAGRITPADGVDGLHLSADAHRRLGLAIADKIRAILE